jgi:hypothetical protein
MSLVIAVLLAFQNINPVAPLSYADLAGLDVPVIAGDINDRPYRVVAEVKATVRKVTRFSPDPSEQWIYREIWQQASKVGADAVVNAKYGEAIPGVLAYAHVKASGQAIKFLSDAEIAQMREQSSTR